MDFVFFILLNAVLLVRPEELVPDIAGLRLFLIVIGLCLALSRVKLAEQLGGQTLVERPITACVLGVLCAVVASHLSSVNFGRAADAAGEFGKSAVYYLLLVAVIDTPARLRAFLSWIVGFTVVLAGLALLQFHGVIDVEALAPVEQREYFDDAEAVVYPRLCSTGIYNDPNDLCLILVMAMAVCLYRLGGPEATPARAAWLAPLVFFGYALSLTRSRGGFLAMLVGLLAFITARYGWRRALPLALVAVPAMALLFGGRQTNISLSGNDTSQHRLQLWAEGLALLPGAPVFGIGYGEYAEECGLVAHNSYVHAYVETGLVGGALFASAFFLALWAPYRARPDAGEAPDPELARLRPYLIALVAAYMAGMFSLSRNYVLPTYLVLGLATAYMRLAAPPEREPWFRLDATMVKLLAAVGAGAIVFLKLFTMTFVSYG